jgi:RNA polymerase sigma-70 factor (ECF subfamily)
MTVETFKIEVLPLKNKLYRLAYRLLGNGMDSEDMVQEVMLKLWARREKLGEYKSVEAFAMVILKNMCLDKMKAKGYRTDDLDEWENDSGYHSPHKNLELIDTTEKVKMIIDELPKHQKMVIHLRDVEGYEFEEITELMQMSLNTIRVNLSRARKKVRETLVKKYSYEFTRN